MIPQCQDFRYLGSKVMSPDSILRDQRTQAWRASHLLRHIFNSSAEDALKLRLFRAAVEPILLYGLEAVPMTDTRQRALDAAYRSLLRNALGVHYPEKLSSEALMERCRVPDVHQTLRARRQRLLGHCLRSLGRGRKIPLALTILSQPTERLRRGQARTVILRTTFVQDLKALGLTPESCISFPSPLFSQRVRAKPL